MRASSAWRRRRWRWRGGCPSPSWWSSPRRPPRSPGRCRLATVQVQVRIGGALRERLGQRRVVTLAAGATVADLLAALAAEAGVAPETLARVAVARGGAIVPPTQQLVAGDEL